MDSAGRLARPTPPLRVIDAQPTGDDPAAGTTDRRPAGGIAAEASAQHRLAAQLRREVAAALAQDLSAPTGARRQAARRLVTQALDRYAEQALSTGRALLDPAAEAAVEQAVLDGLFGLGGLQRWLDDPDVENLNANGADRVFVRYADGTRARVPPIADTDDDLIDLIRLLAARTGHDERRFDRGAPALTLQLPGGDRLFAVMAVTGRPCIAIRRHRYRDATLPDLITLGTLDEPLAAQLSALVRARKNILIVGGPAAGKTTLLRALANEIDPRERLITIEDTLELALDADPDRHPDVVALQARDANIEGTGAVDLADLVRWSLRMSPDRVIVGEVRGAELIPMLNAMSQGADGSMSTLHSSTTAGAFTKLAAYAAQAPEHLTLEATTLLIAAAVHVVIHLDTTPEGTRVISSLREVVGADGPQIISNEVHTPGPDHRAVAATPWRTSTVQEMVTAGLDPAWLHPHPAPQPVSYHGGWTS